MDADTIITQLEDGRKKFKVTPARIAYWKSLVGKKQPKGQRERQSKMAKEKGYGKWMKGKHLSEETKRKISEHNAWRGKVTPNSFKDGELHPKWKGDAVGYQALHSWVYRKMGRPRTCEKCSRKNLTSRFIGWANKSGEYKREVGDWIRLCTKCHYHFDDGYQKKWKKKTQLIA